MSADNLERRQREAKESFAQLSDRAKTFLMKFGRMSGKFGTGDFALQPEFSGFSCLGIFIENLALLTPEIVAGMQRIVRSFSGWELVLLIMIPDHLDDWPNMDIVIKSDEVIENLKREYFPAAYQSIPVLGSPAPPIPPDYPPMRSPAKLPLSYVDSELYLKREQMHARLSDCVDELLGKWNRARRTGFMVHGDYDGGLEVVVCIENLALLHPAIVTELQHALRGFPGWRIDLLVFKPGPGSDWPSMGVFITQDEVVDDLKREYFPLEFQSIVFPGARIGPPSDDPLSRSAPDESPTGGDEE